MAAKRKSEEQTGERIELEGEEVKSTLFGRLIDSGLDLLIHTSEDGQKATIKPFALPKEVINYLFSQIDRSKNDIVSLFGREFKRFLEATDLSEEVVKAMSQMSIEVKANITFKRKQGENKLSINTEIEDDDTPDNDEE